MGQLALFGLACAGLIAIVVGTGWAFGSPAAFLISGGFTLTAVVALFIEW